MTKLVSTFAFAMLTAVAAHASQITVQGTWGTDALIWNITGNEQQQTWDLATGANHKVLTVSATNPNNYQIKSADGKSALAIAYSADTTLFKGQLDGRNVDLKVDHTNNGTLWFNGVFKDHRPSLRIDLPRENVEGRATGFYKNELADLYIVPREKGYWLKGYMNGYWIDVEIMKHDNKYSLEGSYMSKKMSLLVTADTAIDDVIEYLLLDMPLPHTVFLNLNNKNF